MTSTCGKNKKVAHEASPSVSLMFLPHFDVLSDLLLNQTHGNVKSFGGQPRDHLIRVLNERSVNDGGDFCLLWLVILKSA